MKGRLLAAVLSMSLAGSAAILLVLPLRRLLRGAPKAFCYLLWFGALFRLLCPADIGLFSISAPAPSRSTAVQQELTSPADTIASNDWTGQGDPGQTLALNQKKRNRISWKTTAEALWLAGAASMTLYGAGSLLRLKGRLARSVPLRDRIRLADHIQSPFVLGLLRPQIYLPSGLAERERDYLILHEQIHIRRGDHLVKLLAFGALAIHWFNPLVWLAFHLMEQDMEMSCDEATVKRVKRDIRAEYAASLLKFAAGVAVSHTLPAFGKGETKNRVQNVMSYRRPSWKRIFGSSALVVLSFALAGCGLKQESAPQEQASGESWMERYDVPEDFMRQTTCAFVLSVERDQLEADPAEYVGQEDRQRIQELHLTEAADMPDGYYIYNPERQTESWTLTQDTQYIFIDWGRDFVEDPDAEDIVICTQDQALFERYLATYSQGSPKMPFFFEVEEGIVRRVIEYPFA